MYERSITRGLGLSLFALAFSAVAVRGQHEGVNWPSFRGPGASGVSEGHATPTTWNVKESRNIRWKTAIPGLAHSSPIIWGDRLFVTSAVSSDKEPYLRVGLYGASPDHPEDLEHDFRLYCLDKKNGKVLWERTAHRGIPQVKRHIKSTHANCTPATDGKHVVAFFGSEGLYCYDLEGNLVWKKDLGLLDAGPYDAPGLQWAFASSPIIHDGRVIVQCDARNQAFLAAFDIKDGKELWRTAREDVPTWGTPAVHVGENQTQIIVNGYKHMGGYDAATGKELWKLSGGGDVPTPTPVVAGDLIYITNAHGRLRPLYAVRASARGDITLAPGKTRNEAIAWSYPKRGIYQQTPIVYRGLIYMCRGNGILTVYDAKTGKKQYGQRLGTGSTGFTASAVAGDGKLYFTSEEGDISVIKAGPTFELVAENEMGDICMASPALSEGTLFYRTRHHVIAIGDSGAD